MKERIAEQEKISVSKEDIEKMAETDAPRMGVTKEQLLRYYLSSGTVSERLLSDRVMVFLKEHANPGMGAISTRSKPNEAGRMPSRLAK